MIEAANQALKHFLVAGIVRPQLVGFVVDHLDVRVSSVICRESLEAMTDSVLVPMSGIESVGRNEAPLGGGGDCVIELNTCSSMIKQFIEEKFREEGDRGRR